MRHCDSANNHHFQQHPHMQSQHNHHHNNNHFQNSNMQGFNHQSENENSSSSNNSSSTNLNQQIRSRINSFKMSMFNTPKFYKRTILKNFSINIQFNQKFKYFCIFNSARIQSSRITKYGLKILVSAMEF